MKSQTTSGTHKEYKPGQKIKSLLDIPKRCQLGQLVTIGNCVFRIEKNESGLPACLVCNLNRHQNQQREWCNNCMLHSTLQDRLQNYYLKLVKHKG